MIVIILRGGSGSGKSTLIERKYPKALVFSADAFFLNEEGVYNFDITKIGDAHAWCFKSFVNCCQSLDPRDDATVDPEDNTVAIVDNTNTSIAEFAPYAQVAAAYSHEVQIKTFVYDPVVAFKRNTHGSPLDVCMRQHMRMMRETDLIPSWWKHEFILAEET